MYIIIYIIHVNDTLYKYEYKKKRLNLCHTAVGIAIKMQLTFFYFFKNTMGKYMSFNQTLSIIISMCSQYFSYKILLKVVKTDRGYLLLTDQIRCVCRQDLLLLY